MSLDGGLGVSSSEFRPLWWDVMHSGVTRRKGVSPCELGFGKYALKYDNTHGSLYKIALERGWNAYQFDAVKRIDRASKKGQFEEDIRKTKKVLDLWEKERAQPEQEIKVGDKYCCIDKESSLYGEIVTISEVVDNELIVKSKYGTTWDETPEYLNQFYKKVEQ